MSTIAYTSMKEQMNKGAFTEISAKDTINNLYIRQAITSDEYDELMDMANKLNANSDDGELNIRLVAIETDIKELKNEVKLIKEAVESGSTEIPEPEPDPTGGPDDPITAYRGMTYFKDKYYSDPEDSNIYLCTRDSDTEPGSGVALSYLPHELVGIYFQVKE